MRTRPTCSRGGPAPAPCVFRRDGRWCLVYQLRGIRYHVSGDPLDWHGTPPRTFSTTKWLFRWADPERDLHIYKTRSFFGVLRFGLVRWDGDRMLPDHGTAAGYQMPWP